MTKIHLVKIDEVYHRLHTEPSVEEEISDYFTFMTPGHEFSPAFKSRHWDGKIRLYNKKSKKLYNGLLRHLKQFAKERGYEVEGDQYVAENVSLEETKAFMDGLKLSSKGKPITPREDQITAVTKALRYRNCVLLSPTSSGKSLIIYSIVRYLLQHKSTRGLIIVPNVSLVEQMYKDFEDYSTLNGWRVGVNTQKIYSGQSKDIRQSLVISTWQSIYDIGDENFFKQFDFIIGDEAHNFKAKSLGTIMTQLTQAKYRIGTTGTIDDDAVVHKLAIEAYFGPITKIISTKELMDMGASAKLTIKCLLLKYSEEECRAVSLMDYPKEMEFLVGHVRRNNFIANLALSLKGNSLVLFQFVDKHGKPLYELIKAKNKDPNRKIFFVAGEVEVEVREEVRRITELESNAIIVASYGVFSTGVNIKNLHNAIFASPSKSKYRNLQSIGRTLRVTDTKDSATLYDIADDLRIGNHVNYTLKHFALRVQLYHAEKFTIKTYTIGLTTK